MAGLIEFMSVVSKEPPFRIISAAIVKRFSKSLRTRALWDTHSRPQYLTGVLTAADQAVRENVSHICVLEFGVASGEGLIALQDAAKAVEKETGVIISVYGFDLGSGLPALTGNFRDHPDKWQGGDFPMLQPEKLKQRLTSRTRLLLGDVCETVDEFVVNTQPAPVGFVSFDLDLYSSTCAAMRVLNHPNKKMLRHVPLYFDDTLFFGAHRFAGERLAVDEFNNADYDVKIDMWRVLKFGRPFSDRQWLDAMYVAHHLTGVADAVAETRETQTLPPPAM